MNPFKRGSDMRLPGVRAQKPEPVARDGVATVRLYDAIDSWGGDWGVSAKEFATVLDGLPDDVKEIRLLINSPGGEVFEGVAIMNALRAHSARVVAVVEGIAASSASFIAASADELVMMRNSELFIHNAWTIALGDAADLRAVADELEQFFDRNIASVYAAKSGKDVEHWLAEMHKDRFLTADEAVAEGLADRIEGDGDAAAARARFDLSVFSRREESRLPAAAALIGDKLPDSTEPGDPNPEEDVVAYDTLKAGLRERLGVTDADASDDTLLAAVDEALAEQPEPTTTAVPEGAVVIDEARYAQLEADAAAGREAREQQTAERRDRIVADALKEGRIAPASREKWRAQLDKDEDGIRTLLESFPKNTAVSVAEVGHQEEPTEDDRLYAAAWGADEKGA